jgi:diguanylate cyclase (GGDEF)-like protein
VLTPQEETYLRGLRNKGQPLVIGYSYELQMPSYTDGAMLPLSDVLRDVLNIPVELVKSSRTSAHRQLKTGELDYYGPAPAYEAAEDFEVLGPLYNASMMVVSRVSDPVGGPLNLRGARVGLLEDTPLRGALANYLAPIGDGGDSSVTRFTDMHEMISALANGRIDCLATVYGIELELAQYAALQYEFQIGGADAEMGMLTESPEYRELTAIVNRYLRETGGISGEIETIRRAAILQNARIRLRDDISEVQRTVAEQGHTEARVFNTGMLFPVCYEQDGEMQGVVPEIHEVFTTLTGLNVRYENTDSYPEGVEAALADLAAGRLLAIVGLPREAKLGGDDRFQYSPAIWEDNLGLYAYRDIPDLRGLRVGTSVIAGSNADLTTLTGLSPVVYHSRPAFYEALHNGEVEAGFLSEAMYHYVYTVRGDTGLRAVTGLSVPSSEHVLFNSVNTAFNAVYNESLRLYKLIYPENVTLWKGQADEIRASDLRLSDARLESAVVFAVLFALLFLALVFFLRRYFAYDRQIARLLHAQQTIDFLWINTRSGRISSKGEYPLLRLWGFPVRKRNLRLSALEDMIDLELRGGYQAALEIMNQEKTRLHIADRTVTAPIDGLPRHFRQYLHKLNGHRMMAFVQDVTEERERTEELTHIASTDYLSNLQTRRAMSELLARRSEELLQSGGGAFLAMFDIDDFKKVNDTYGHEIGDRVLKMVAEAIQNTPGCERNTSRWGGEEFLLLLESGSLDEAIQRIEDILRDIENREVRITDKKSVHVTVSAGVAELDPHRGVTDSVTRADAGLYRAKREGKNCVRTVPEGF